MVGKMKFRFFSALIFASLIFTVITSVTSASGAGLRADITRYDPCPAEIGQYLTVWVKIENVGYWRADDVSVEIVPSYPFFLDPHESSVKNIGILPDEAAIFKFRIYVDENAKPGTREIKVRYQDSKDSGWIEKSFNIEIGSDSFNSKGTIQLQNIKTEPEVLMPGDKGTVTLTLKNTATQYSISLDGKEYSTNVRVNSASLLSSEDITVKSSSYREVGVLGPGGTVDLTYNIEVAQNAGEGTKHLEFKVTGSSRSYSYNWDVPVKVDSASLRIIPSKSLTLKNTTETIEFDIANVNHNTLYSVSIRPVAEGIEFSPAEYFIGSMDPDELFTIEFKARAASGNTSGTKDLTLLATYRNGHNQHTTALDNLRLTISPEKPENSSLLHLISALLGVSTISGVIIYRHRKQHK